MLVAGQDAVVGDVQSRGGGVEAVRVRRPADRDQHRVRLDGLLHDAGLLLALRAIQAHPDPAVRGPLGVLDRFDPGRGPPRAQVPPSGRDPRERRGHGHVVLLEQPVAAVDLDDLGAQPGEDGRELAGDEPAAHHEQPPRQPIQSHDGVRGVHRRQVQTWDLREGGPRPRGDHDLVRRDLPTRGGAHAAGTDEAHLLLDHARVVQIIPAVAQPVPADAVDAREDAVPDGREVGARELQPHPEAPGLGGSAARLAG